MKPYYEVHYKEPQWKYYPVNKLSNPCKTKEQAQTLRDNLKASGMIKTAIKKIKGNTYANDYR